MHRSPGESLSIPVLSLSPSLKSSLGAQQTSPEPQLFLLSPCDKCSSPTLTCTRMRGALQVCHTQACPLSPGPWVFRQITKIKDSHKFQKGRAVKTCMSCLNTVNKNTQQWGHQWRCVSFRLGHVPPNASPPANAAADEGAGLSYPSPGKPFWQATQLVPFPTRSPLICILIRIIWFHKVGGGCESVPHGRRDVELQTPGHNQSHREPARVWHTPHPPHSARACRDIITKRSGPDENLLCWPKPEKGPAGFCSFQMDLGIRRRVKKFRINKLKMFLQRMGKWYFWFGVSWRCWHLTENYYMPTFGSQSRVGL